MRHGRHECYGLLGMGRKQQAWPTRHGLRDLFFWDLTAGVFGASGWELGREGQAQFIHAPRYQDLSCQVFCEILFINSNNVRFSSRTTFLSTTLLECTDHHCVASHCRCISRMTCLAPTNPELKEKNNLRKLYCGNLPPTPR